MKLGLNDDIPCPGCALNHLHIVGVISGFTYVGCKRCGSVFQVQGGPQMGFRFIKSNGLRLQVKGKG